jgi:transposase
MMAYSMDLRVRVLADCDAGMKPAKVAEKYRVSSAWVRRLKQRRRTTGSIEAKTAPGPKPTWETLGYAEALRAAVARKPDSTLAELKRELQLSVTLSTLWCACRALGLKLKKKSAARRSKTVQT